jgi:hypothetical protein
MGILMRRALLVLLLLSAAAAPRAQADLQAPLDHILDTYVRDGFVSYRALQSDRASLDRYVASIDIASATVLGWPKAEQEAFWVNAYNAIVLKTVIDHYPIKGKSADYPQSSIRQIPGAFEQIRHQVGGRSLTLDEIEKTVIARFGDARLLLALGRGARGSGRLRSEVYRAGTIETQLGEALTEFVTRPTCLHVDRDRSLVEVSPLIGWREDVFIASFADAGARWTTRSPIERAILGMAFPHLYPSERDVLAQDVFQVKYGTFDWRLNDLASPYEPTPH